MRKLTGKCLCESIEYEITGELGPIFNCPCSKCRRWHGADFRTRAYIKKEQFHWVKGEELLSTYYSSDTVSKTFCSNCGSNLMSYYDNLPDVIGVPLGGISGDLGRLPEAHIFVGSKATWFEITDDIPQHEFWPGSEAKVRETNTEK